MLDAFLELLSSTLELISPKFLLEEPPAVQSPLYLVLLVVFAVCFVGGVVLSFGATRLSGGNRLHRMLMHRYGAWAAWLGLAGSLLVGLRYWRIPLFSKRIWILLNLLGMIAVAVHFYRYKTREYPQAVVDYREHERRRRFFTTRRGPRRALGRHR